MNGQQPVMDDQEVAMDCEHAREQLDATRQDFPEREDSELREAFAHLDQCAPCAEVYEFRSAFDRRMRTVVRQVDVPADLQARLQAALTVAAEPVRPVATETIYGTKRPGPRGSRRAFLLATSAATLLIAVGWTWVVNHRPPTPMLAATVLDWWQQRLSGSAGFKVNELPEFDGQFEPTIADGRWQSRVMGPPRGVDFDEDGRQDSDPPAVSSAVTANPGYAPAPHVAWTQGGSMHICYLPGGSRDQLQRLLKQVNRAA